jgi:MFS family permease
VEDRRPSAAERAPAPAARVRLRELPTAFRLFALSAAASTAGLMTFGVISYAAVANGLVDTAVVPVVYAGAMAVEALGALATGATYDRAGARVLYPLPLLVAAVPALVFADRLGPVLLGIALWALATGIQDSTVKALVADLVPRTVLGTSYGLFAAAQGLAALAGGALAGALYADHLGVLVAVVAGLQLLSLVTLVPAVRHARPAVAAGGPDGVARG